MTLLCCETGGTGTQDVEDLAVFVAQLNALGARARVHAGSVPRGLSRNAQFDLAPFLVDGALGPGDPVVLVGAHRLTDVKLAQLRRLAGAQGRECLAFGSFESDQAMIGIKARLSYVLGREPRVFNLLASRTGETGGTPDCPVLGARRWSKPATVPRALLVAPDLREGGQAAALVALSLSRGFRVAVLTDGKSKQDWRSAHGTEIDVYHYGEILPTSLAERVEICVTFVSPRINYRLRSLLANIAYSGGALIDATVDHAIARADDAFLPGPIDVVGLAGFLDGYVIPGLERIAEHTQAARTAVRGNTEEALRFLGLGPRPSRRATGRAEQEARLVFMPTNGVGLGHAQRCSLIAAELDPARGRPVFAAFPSCLKLIKSHGFDAMPLIGRSGFHAQTHENDLANYTRLRALSAGGGALVFDGGYVFDSVYRSIMENRLDGIWIRRGLWQSGQDNSVALDREKAFARVIVPREAFDELNASYSRGDHLRAVGPIVQRVDLTAARRAELRAILAERYGREFDRLVISLLGAGVAADRGAQIQALCGMMERRSDVLHLVVVWPTAVTQPVWFGWKNSHVVRTHHAGVLTAAADLCVSAAGYNSFHEMLYTGTPAIFIPQTGSFMDDQQARARAARERGVAGMVEAHELMTLEREVGRFLDEGGAEAARARIAALDLAEPGNAAAARMIEEFMNGYTAVERHPVTDIAAGRR